ncbi:MAG: hypothetical protein IJ901_07415 [Bacteroidaceae bacterium]|nr:hypothetical protein [Bacteroidaceae bacterium]
MKKITLKALLMAAALGMGGNAWADTKLTFYSNDFSSSSSLDLISVSATANQTLSLETDSNVKYGQYVKQETQDRTRDVYMDVSSLLSASFADYTNYTIEFDAAFRSGSTNRTGGNSLTLKSTKGSEIFKMATPTEQVNAGNLVFTVSGAAEGKEITLTSLAWYHFKFDITTTSVTYTITLGSDNSAVKNGTGTLAITDSKIQQIYFGTARNYGQTRFDNIDIYTSVSGDVANDPTITMTGVKGENREYTITFGDGETLHYTTPGGTEQTTTTSPLVITITSAGTLSAYTTKGSATSSSKQATVTHGAIVLNAPVFSVVGIVEGADGFYYPQITFASNNSSLEGTPTATYDVASPYTFTSTGSITVTASAEGYTSCSNTFTVENPYVNSKTIDFGALTDSDFDPTIWTTATGAPRDLWTNRAAAIPADATYYKFVSESITPNDDTDLAHKSAIEGITLTNCYQRTANVYVGYGLLSPYDVPKVDNNGYSGNASNNLNITVNGATAEDYVVYNGWNNYGSGTFNTVQAGNATFALYRYDTMLRTIKVYSPAPATVSKTITSAGYATYYSPYALDFSSTGLTAYIATYNATDKEVSFSEVTSVPANTGILLKGAEGNYAIPVVASSNTDVAGNVFVGVTEDTEVDAGIFVLLNGAQGVGFYKTENAFTVGANTAYISVPSGVKARFIGVEEDDDATAITAIEATEAVNNGVIYNLSGQRVVKPLKGIYIQNGKKIIVK